MNELELETIENNEEEQQILDDLDTTAVFTMRERIRQYIKNNVQLEREGLKRKLQNL